MSEYVIFVGDITEQKILKDEDGYFLYYADYYEAEIWERVEYIVKRYFK